MTNTHFTNRKSLMFNFVLLAGTTNAVIISIIIFYLSPPAQSLQAEDNEEM